MSFHLDSAMCLCYEEGHIHVLVLQQSGLSFMMEVTGLELASSGSNKQTPPCEAVACQGRLGVLDQG